MWNKIELLKDMTQALKEFNDLTNNEFFYAMYQSAKSGEINPVLNTKQKLKTKNNKAESEILKECLSVLKELKIFHWRQNTGAFKTTNGGFFRSSIAGVSDILGLLPNGKFLAIECKRESGGVLSDSQHKFLQNIVNNNGVAIICSDSMQLKKILEGML